MAVQTREKKGKPVASPHQFRVVFALRRLQQIDFGVPETPSILSETYEDSGSPSADPARPITQPPYPNDALIAGQEGEVILQFIVEADGFVDPNSIVVKQSSGYPSLDKAAVSEAAVNWRFQPAMLNGTPVSAPHRFRVVFEISRPSQEE